MGRLAGCKQRDFYFLVSDEVMTAMSDLPTPQGILAVMTLTSEDTPDFQEAGFY